MEQDADRQAPGHFLAALQEFDHRQRDYDAALNDFLERAGFDHLYEVLASRQQERDVAWKGLASALCKCLATEPTRATFISGPAS